MFTMNWTSNCRIANQDAMLRNCPNDSNVHVDSDSVLLSLVSQSDISLQKLPNISSVLANDPSTSLTTCSPTRTNIADYLAKSSFACTHDQDAASLSDADSSGSPARYKYKFCFKESPEFNKDNQSHHESVPGMDKGRCLFSMMCIFLLSTMGLGTWLVMAYAGILSTNTTRTTNSGYLTFSNSRTNSVLHGEKSVILTVRNRHCFFPKELV